MGRRLSAVSGTKGIHHEYVAQCGIRLRQFIGVFFLAFVKAHVFQQHHFASGDFNAFAKIFDNLNVTAEQAGQVGSNRLDGRFFVVHAFFRTTQVGHNNHLGTGIQSQLNGWQRRTDTRIGCDLAVLYRNVQVFTDQNALTAQIQIGHFQYSHDNPTHNIQ